MTTTLSAGAAAFDVSPRDRQFLFGYPHVQRYSTGIHDPLLASALYLNDGDQAIILVGVDIIFVGKESVRRVRQRIFDATGVPADHILISATHTHSGPITIDYISNEADPVVPKADPQYVQLLEDGIVEAARSAAAFTQTSQIALTTADAPGVGTNRRDPAGPADPQVPVLLVRSAATGKPLACMLVCSMHPTVLHEDSTLVSGDFPGLARQYLRQHVLGPQCPVLIHTGPAGNQSPRHVTRANTFAEAERLGVILGQAVEKSLTSLEFRNHAQLSCQTAFTDLPRKTFPSVPAARQKLDQAVQRLETLRRQSAPRTDIRTAECDWFGAEETLTLARAAADGRLDQAAHACLPAEIQLLRIGPWNFVGWQGEIFVDYALAVKKQHPDTFIISLANGELQGYIVTPEAAAEGGYEASNALFAPQSGHRLVQLTLNLINQPATSNS